MSDMLKIGTRTVKSDEILSLLAGYQMMPQFLKEIMIDDAIAEITCTEEENESAFQAFYQQNQIVEPEARQAWLAHFRMTQEQLESLATRELRIEKFKKETWGPKLESYFLDHKGRLDKVIYSLIRTKDMGISQELYFRISEDEQSFAETAREYSQGPEAQTDGLIGPVELSVPHPSLAKILSISQPGQLSPPTRVGEWVVIVRLERYIPAQLDDAMRQRLLNETFDNWVKEQLHQLTSSDINETEDNAAHSNSSTADSSATDGSPTEDSSNSNSASTDSKAPSVAS